MSSFPKASSYEPVRCHLCTPLFYSQRLYFCNHRRRAAGAAQRRVREDQEPNGYETDQFGAGL